MKVYTGIKVLKDAWKVLKELNLDGLLMGDATTIDIPELLNALLEEDKLNEFCQVITKSEKDFEEYDDIDKVAKLVSDFFVHIGDAFSGLKIQAKPATKK